MKKILAAWLLASTICFGQGIPYNRLRITPSTGSAPAVGELDFATADNQHYLGMSLGGNLTSSTVFNLPGANWLNVSSSTPLQVYSHFRDDDQYHLYVGFSTDGGAHWTETAVAGVYSNGTCSFRDPTIYLWDGTWYFMATPCSGTLLQFISSTDLIHFSAVSTFDLSTYVTGATDTWAPEFYDDPNGGGFGFFVVVSTDHASTFYPHWFGFNLTGGGSITSHTAFTINGTTRNQIFDLFPYYSNGTYYLLYTDQQSTTTQYVVYATSGTLTGTYTQVQASGVDYFGFVESGLVGSEAPGVLTLTNGCLRVYADTYDTPYPAGREYWTQYRDYCGGAPFSTSTMTAPAKLQIPASEHGTIINVTTATDAATVFNAYYQQQNTSWLNGRIGINGSPERFTLTLHSRAAYGGIEYTEPVTYAADPGDGNVATLTACGGGTSTSAQYCPPPYGGSGRWIIQETGLLGSGILQINNTNAGTGEASILLSNGLTTYGQNPVATNGGQSIWELGENNHCWAPSSTSTGCTNNANDWFYIHNGKLNDFLFGGSPVTGEWRANYGLTLGAGSATFGVQTDYANIDALGSAQTSCPNCGQRINLGSGTLGSRNATLAAGALDLQTYFAQSGTSNTSMSGVLTLAGSGTATYTFSSTDAKYWVSQPVCTANDGSGATSIQTTTAVSGSTYTLTLTSSAGSGANGHSVGYFCVARSY